MTIVDVLIIISILCFFFGFLLILWGVIGLIDPDLYDEHPYFDTSIKKYTRVLLIGILLLILAISGMLWVSNIIS